MKILIVRYKKTQSVFEGGEMASNNNYRSICQVVGAEQVETYYIHDESRRRTLMDYARGVFWFPFGYYFGLTPRRLRAIVQKAQGFDAVFVDRSVFGIVAKRLKESGYAGRVVGFYHNVEVLYFAAKYAHNALARRVVCRCADKNDRWTALHCDRTIALNERDDRELQRRYGRKADLRVPISLADRYADAQPSEALTREKPLCMFLGAYFPANVEGIEWFVREVKPQVDVQVRIVGKGMEKLKDAPWLTPDIEVVANAPDLRPLFEEADIMVLPIFKGSGMKVKTCESLMYGKHIIGTQEAWEGYELDYGRAGARCESATEFVEALHQYQRQPRPRYNAYSRQVFLEKYSESSCIDSFRQALI